MVYPYMTLADGTEIVYTNVFEEDGIKKVEVHFERPTEKGFDTARCHILGLYGKASPMKR